MEKAEQLCLVDSHAHIYGEKFKNDLEQIISDAKQIGVQAIINVSEGAQSAQEIKELHLKYPILKPAIGLHPIVENRCVKREEVLAIEKVIRDSTYIVAIGEC